MIMLLNLLLIIFVTDSANVNVKNLDLFILELYNLIILSLLEIYPATFQYKAIED